MWVIGNGESRKSINLDSLQGLKIGCNAIFRDHTVEHLVCVDRRMVKESIEFGANQNSLVYTRKDWMSQFNNFKRIRSVPDLPYVGSERWDEPFQWGSGPYAVLLGAKLQTERTVNLIGFDLWSKTNTINNIYKDTQNYDSSFKRPVDPRYWIHQIGMIFKCYPKITFCIYQESDWEPPQAWIRPNVRLQNISNIS